MIIGRFDAGSTPHELAADTKLVVRHRFDFIGVTWRIPKLTMYLDGLGSGVGSEQLARGVVYAETGELLGSGDEITVVRGQVARWVDLPFLSVPGGIELPHAGSYDIGIHAGAFTNLIRVYT